MDGKNAEEVVSSESDIVDSKDSTGCATSYLLDERETLKKPLPQKFRERWSKAALGLAIVSLISSVGFSVASFIISKKTESSSVFAAGFDAFFAAVNVTAVCWRFRDELNGTIGPSREKIATTVIAVTFLLGGIATLVISFYHLRENDHPENADDMLVVLAVGFLIYSILGTCQYHVSVLLQSSSMRALAVDSWLASAMVVGLLVSAWFYRKHSNLWFLDHAIASVLGVVSAVYGVILGIKVHQLNLKEKLAEAFRRDF